MRPRLPLLAPVLAAASAGALPGAAWAQPPCASPGDTYVAAQVRAGAVADLSRRPPGQRTVSAACLASLLTGPKQSGRPIQVRHAVVSGPLDLSHLEVRSAVKLRHVTFGSAVTFYRTRFQDDVVLDSSTFRGAVELSRGRFAGNLEVRGAEFRGRVDLSRATVGDTFEGDSAHFARAAIFHTIHVEGDLRLQDARFLGPLSFENAHVGRDLVLTRARFGTAVDTVRFDNARVDGSLFVEQAGVVTRMLSFLYTQVGSHLRADDNVWKQELKLDGVRTGVHLDLSPGTFEQGLSSIASSVGGNLELNGIVSPKRVNFERTRVEGELRAAKARIGFASFRRMTVQGRSDLRQAAFSGSLNLQDASLHTVLLDGLVTPRGTAFILGGMTYSRLVRSGDRNDPDSLIALLDRASFNAEAYGSLEKFFSDQGDGSSANAAYIRRWDREGGNLEWYKRIARFLFKWTVGYGRWPALAFGYGVLFVLAGVFVFTRGRMLPAELPPGEDGARQGPHYSRFLYSLDAFLPMVNLQYSDDWKPNRSVSRAAWVYLRIHTIAGWLLIPIGLAAITGLLK